MADHIEADAGTFLLQIGHAEFAGLPLDGVEHEGGFCSARAFDLAGALFKFGARAADDGGVAQGLEDLRRLAGVKFLLTLVPGDVREQPGGAGGRGQVAETMVVERVHERQWLGRVLQTSGRAIQKSGQPMVCDGKVCNEMAIPVFLFCPIMKRKRKAENYKPKPATKPLAETIAGQGIIFNEAISREFARLRAKC